MDIIQAEILKSVRPDEPAFAGEGSCVPDKRFMSALLKRFWFETERGYGIGVSAYSLEDAESLIQEIGIHIDKNIVSVIEDVDIRTLDQGHVIPNMGPPNFRGVWFPNFIIK